MTKLIPKIIIVAMYAALISVFLYIIGIEYAWLALAISATLMFLGRLYLRARETDRNTMRLLSIQLFSSVMLLASAYLMYTSRRYWVIPLLITSAVEFYISFRLDRK